MSARHLVIGVTYFHGDDKTESEREVELSVPGWAYRPLCWVEGHADDTYGSCVVCHKSLDRGR